jgi:hypothetical protein
VLREKTYAMYLHKVLTIYANLQPAEYKNLGKPVALSWQNETK